MTKNANMKKLWNRNFALLWQAHLVSQIGTQLLIVVQVLWIKQASGLATLVGLTSIVWAVGSVLSGPLGGSFADHHSRQRILVTCDFIAGLGSLLIFLAFLLFPGAFAPIYVLVVVVSFMNGVIRSFFNSAVQSALPDLVPQERLQQANALKTATLQISQLVGQGIGAVLFRFIGAPFLYFIDGATYLFSSASSLFIRLPPRASEKKHTGLAAGMTHHWGSMKEGIRYLVREPGLNLTILVFCALNFCVAPLYVLLPFFVDQNLKAGAEWYGFLLGGFGIGILAGYAGSGLLKLPPRRRAAAWGLALVVMSVIAVSGFFFTNVWAALGFFFAAGLCYGFVNIVFITGFQKRTPESLRGRLFGVIGSLTIALMPIGTALGSVANDLWPGHVREILTASFILMLAATVVVFPNKNLRKYMSWE
jgi:DHA3 family macrolide efflux protein-like MFS transporter